MPIPHYLKTMPTAELAQLGKNVADALFARVLDRFADDCVENVHGIKDDITVLVHNTEWNGR